MKKIMSASALALLIASAIPTIATADIKKGQRIYKKHFYKKCGFSGVVFSRNHLQAEWEEIYEEGNYPQEAKRICPEIELGKIKDQWWKDLYDYSVEYAKDGVPPNGCND